MCWRNQTTRLLIFISQPSGDLNSISNFFFSPAGQSNFRCPEKDGYFEDTNQCDKYYDCLDGIAEERLCPDGLVFDPFSRKREPCDHYFNVDCGDRLDLQPPKGPSDLCPRLNGFYSHPDPGVCHIFYACVDGTAEEYTCSSGLWFDEYSGVCNWPETTDRKDCKADSYGLYISSSNPGISCRPILQLWKLLMGSSVPRPPPLMSLVSMTLTPSMLTQTTAPSFSSA